MADSWRLVTLAHVQQACALFDAGTARPSHPPRNTFVLLGANRYPGKFIRGLAYKLATGRTPNVYHGGAETVAFFDRLGITTEYHGNTHTPPARTATPLVAWPPTTPRAAAPPRAGRLKDPQKETLLSLLRHRFGAVGTEASFDWLAVPASAAMSGAVASIHAALEALRGQTGFATAGWRLCCDFHVPCHRLLVEYDERQHFTLPRAAALRQYPPGLKLHFDGDQWVAACERVRANDPTPPYRDEQRAFYDALRDIRAAENEYTLIRLREGAFDWTGVGADAEFDRVLSAHGVSVPTSGGSRGPVATAGRGGTTDVAERMRKIALVSHDYRHRDRAGRWDYSEHFGEINRACDEAGCDTILYALYTWDTRSALRRTHTAIFDGLTHVRRVVLEVGDLSANGNKPGLSDLAVEAWVRGEQQPRVMRQRFATSKEGWIGAGEFLSDLPCRRVADAVVMICGETNITSVVRASKSISDPNAVNRLLGAMGAAVVLNPIHDYMRRYEMKEKRRYYSRDGRVCVSVWNQGKGRESHLPWTVFFDGSEHTNQVMEIISPVAARPDIRVGVLSLDPLAKLG